MVDTVNQTFPDTSLSNFIDKDTLYKYFKTIRINHRIYFFAEGDLLLSKERFARRLFQEWQAASLQIAYPPYHKTFQEVIVRYDEVKKDTIKWKIFPLRFCINKASFNKHPGGYEIVRENVVKAMNDWSNLCNVSYTYVSEADMRQTTIPYKLDFVIRYVEPDKQTENIAVSFAPDDPPTERNFLLFPSSWTTKYDKVGILRHEIGHIFGFRHEHASAESLVPLDCRQRYQETAIPSRPVTTYDSFSVMHYFCGGAGTRQMKFSARDSIGFTTVYRKK